MRPKFIFLAEMYILGQILDVVYSTDICPPGYFLYTPITGPDICHPCLGHTYMHKQRHTERMCYTCSVVEDPSVERLVSECNKKKDSEILCQNGFYRTPSNPPNVKGKCIQCTQCDHPVQKCNGYQDTVCCPGPNYRLGFNSKGNPVCVMHCGQGEYLNNITNTCQPCTEGTYMSDDSHTSAQCLACPELTSRVETVFRPCTRTRATVIGCVKGYYRSRIKNYMNEQDTCVRCTDCGEEGGDNRYTGRKCDSFQDTVCCKLPNMTVVNTLEGPVCQLASTVILTPRPMICGVDQYLYVDQVRGPIACLPCPTGFYMDAKDHNSRECKKCADFPDRQRYSPCQVQSPGSTPSVDNASVTVIMSLVLSISLSTVLICCIMIKIWMLRKSQNNAMQKKPIKT